MDRQSRSRLHGAIRSPIVSKLAGVSRDQLQYWHETRLIRAHVVPGARGYPRLYSWIDYLKIRAAKKLLDRGIDPRQMRKAIEYLDQHVPDWHQRPLSVFAGRVLIELDERIVTADPTQQVALPALRSVLLEIDEEGPLGALRQFSRHVTMDPEVVAGNPVLRGTRIETRFLAELAERGLTEDRLASIYRLLPAQVHAALEFERLTA